MLGFNCLASLVEGHIVEEMDLIVRNLETMLDKHYSIDDFVSTCRDRKPAPSREIVFVTGNEYKVNELTSQLDIKSISLLNIDLKLPEIQDTDPLYIAQDKCLRAFRKINRSTSSDEPSKLPQSKIIMVEDVCLHFKALNGLPGPYVKCFLDKLKPNDLYRLLADFEDKSARAVCTYALMEEEKELVFCRGSVEGKIVRARGKSWGWDPIFEEPTTGLTFAEMDPEIKCKLSHRARAINVLKEYLKN